MSPDPVTEEYASSFTPLNISPALAVSLLHKSIRRKRPDWALKAAATLLQTSPERLRRRLCVIAFEDIGLGDIQLVKGVTPIAINCTEPAKQEISQLVASMASTHSCRAADDLFVVCRHLPALSVVRKQLSKYSTPQLLSRAATSNDLILRALCLDRALASSSKERQQIFSWLEKQGLAHEVTEVCRNGFRRTREPLCVLLGLLWDEKTRANAPAVLDDPMPSEEIIGEVPCWTYDTHVSEGRAAIARLLAGPSKTARWCRANIPGATQVKFLGSVLFRIESGLVAKRLRWLLADRLREMADIECHGVDPPRAVEVSELLRKDLSKLNDERRHVVRS